MNLKQAFETLSTLVRQFGNDHDNHTNDDYCIARFDLCTELLDEIEGNNG